ncbi:something about silencing protein 10 [Elasticomyces elasticus]|nr:something about silencing protein 10 [Elasticomyces elasticus]
MAKKRRAVRAPRDEPAAKSVRYDVEETFDDSQDDFFQGRDKVLLEQSADTKRRNKLIEQEKDLQPSDEEVLGYGGSEEEDVSEEASEADSDDGTAPVRRKRAGSNDDQLEEDEVEYEGDFGKNRSDYYNADVIETAEDALEEEQEARRLDQKRLQKMSTADFGFDEDEWAASVKDAKSSTAVVEKLPEVTIPQDATDGQKLEVLRSRYPEFEPLATEFAELQVLKDELEAEVAEIATKLNQPGAKLGEGVPAKLKSDALSAYLASLAMYFAVVATSVITDTRSGKITAMPPLDLQDHAVIQSLTRARTLWSEVEAEPTAEVLVPKSTITAPAVQLPRVRSKAKKSRPSDLEELLAASIEPDVSEASDLGDEAPLTATEAAEKAAKKKSLRFYTSQIASKANRRGHAGREAGGDDDLPYKERNRDRIERLQREAEKRGQAAGNDNFDEDDGGEDMEMSNIDRNRDTNDEYYDELLANNASKKAGKQARSEAYAEAAKLGAEVHEQETVGADGKRAITYAIAKNKGLAPRRKKEVRNPRVKKKLKYEEKMKKLGSVRQVYKGGQGKPYGGELTGIKSNLVKSVKL